MSVTGRDTRTVLPAVFRSTALFKVTIARRRDGLYARMAEGDNSIVMVPATARQISGPVESGADCILTSEQNSNCR